MLNKISFDLTDNDLNFIINTAAPNASSKEELKKLILEDESFREGIIGSDKLFSEIVDSIEIMTMVSPRLIFEIFRRYPRTEVRGTLVKIKLRLT